MRPRNKFAQNEADWADQTYYKALGLDDRAKGKFTPSESKPLVKDVNGDLASGAFSYSSVVGMLLYLSGHSCPDITFAVNCCARYMFCPKYVHELALKQIGRYLKQTPDRGMVMNPSCNVCKIDAYLDVDFAGMYGHEEHTDPASCLCQESDWIHHHFCRLSCLLAIQATDRDGSIDDRSRHHSSFCMLQRAVSYHGHSKLSDKVCQTSYRKN
jgi:hypothetical protein